MNPYRYRKHLKILQYVLPVFLFFVIWLISGLFFKTSYVALPVALIIVLVVEGIFIWWFLNRLSAVEVLLSDNSIIYKGKKRVVEIHYEDIVEIKYPSIRYTGGWMMIRSKSEKIRLTVVLEGIGDFVRVLKSRLDQQGLSDKYEEKKLFGFYKTAEYADQSWARIYEMFWRGVGLAILGAVIGAGVLLLFGGMRGGLIWCVAGGSMCWVAMSYVITEFFLMRRFSRSVDEASFTVPERNQQSDCLIYKRAFYIGAGLYLVILILLSLLPWKDIDNAVFEFFYRRVFRDS